MRTTTIRTGPGGRLRAAGAAFVLAAVAACGGADAPEPAGDGAAREAPADASGAPTLEDVRRVAEEVMDLLARQDFAGLAAVVHPVKGLLFSPYAYVDPSEAVVLSPSEVAGLGGEGTVRVWGTYDGSGEPIESDFAGYYREFVYDGDFGGADQVAVDERLGLGNTVDNITEVFPGATTVEYHLPGENPDYGGMDWKSLRLVFEPWESEWRLVAVVHDAWTI